MALPTTTSRRIAALIAAGRLAPAARDMDPREVIEQMCEAEALSPSEAIYELAEADLPARMRASRVRDGDTVVDTDGTRRLVRWVTVGPHETYLAFVDGTEMRRLNREDVDVMPDLEQGLGSD